MRESDLPPVPAGLSRNNVASANGPDQGKVSCAWSRLWVAQDTHTVDRLTVVGACYGVGATFHRFDSDRLGMHYGDELDLIAQARVKRYAFALRYARYRADRFATNTNKLFGTVEWVF